MEDVQKIIPAGIIVFAAAIVEYMNIVCCLINNFTKTAIPAEAGIQTPSLQKQGTIKELDSRLHGNDERKRCIELLGTEHYIEGIFPLRQRQTVSCLLHQRGNRYRKEMVMSIDFYVEIADSKKRHRHYWLSLINVI